uniref:Uncharacterized protein n=1 Tax=Hanusia phi TaxID=3032 RepID=A0A7S0HNG1_9CRYP|mmetsp:Transcript_29190/g.66163  ORF Transcript_29190/g.66163 Transcript_29190/m.66163 type:complete len:380 (+) Transcript_29190:81-1220(+)
MLRVREALLLSVVLFQTESRVSHPELQVPFAGRCSSASSLRLKGGDDDAGSSSQKKMPSKEEVYAFVAQKKREWEYCAQPGPFGLGVPLGDWEIPKDDEIDLEQDPMTYEHILGPNWEGKIPGPEVWKNPSDSYRELGFTVCPDTAPLHILLEDAKRIVRERTEKEEFYEKYGYYPGQPHETVGNGRPIMYWSRECGTDPWPNLRDQLPPGYYQLRFAGSCYLLSPDGTFVHTSNPNEQDPRLWGLQAEDRGRWVLDGEGMNVPGSVIRLQFHDENQTCLALGVHSRDEPLVQKWCYTDEDSELDKRLREFTVSIPEERFCSEEECSTCDDFRKRFIRTGLSEEESTPELPEAAYRAPGLPQETLLAPQKEPTSQAKMQ